MPRADVQVAQTSSGTQYTGGGVQYVVVTPTGAMYLIYVDTGSDLAYKKSLDFGLSWQPPIILHTGTIIGFTVWYDRWSGISAGLIHIAHCDSGTDDTIYVSINTESADALSTPVTVQNTLTSSVAGGSFSIARMRGGNNLLYGVIDAGVEGGFYRQVNANVPTGAWAARTNPEALAADDQMVMMPGFAADNQDAIGIFRDASANQISRYLHDDSANTWGESIFGAPDTFVEVAANASFPHFGAAPDLANSRIIVVAWSAVDAANADLRCFIVTESAITAVTDVVLNGTTNQGLCAIGIDTLTGDWYVVYAGKSDGSEGFGAASKLYYKVSTDDGTTWSAEHLLTALPGMNIGWLACPPNFAGPGQFAVAYHRNLTLDEIMCNVALPPMPAQPLTQGMQVL